VILILSQSRCVCCRLNTSSAPVSPPASLYAHFTPRRTESQTQLNAWLIRESVTETFLVYFYRVSYALCAFLRNIQISKSRTRTHRGRNKKPLTTWPNTEITTTTTTTKAAKSQLKHKTNNNIRETGPQLFVAAVRGFGAICGYSW